MTAKVFDLAEQRRKRGEREPLRVAPQSTPRATAIAAARRWLRLEAGAAKTQLERALAYSVLIALMRSHPLEPAERQYLERHTRSRNPMHARWAKTVLAELEPIP